ncbi:PR domain zinc finger protein 5-like [Armigeres subalbatus]|uniref:PR domain zinc finger protein 5-like n=1 Tax=Armigeres subalbatus TaxID=124917 RepID=UPI002ED4EC55
MVIFQLDQFPDVCRLCIQPKPIEQMIPIECSSMDHGNRTLHNLLNDLSFEVPKDVSELLPKAMCSKCFTDFDFVVQYQRKVKLITSFYVAFARLKAGDTNAIEDLFICSRLELGNLFKELNVCDILDLDQLLEYDPRIRKPNRAETKPEKLLKFEDRTLEINNIVNKQEEAEYYNVEYIEDPEDGNCEKPNDGNQPTSSEAIESVAEFLQETDEDSETLYLLSEGELMEPKELPSPKKQTVEMPQKAHTRKEESEFRPQQSKRKQKIRMIQCPYCKYRTTSKSMFQHHVDRHENPNDASPWKCSFANCSEAYATKEDLLKHKKEIHSKYVCDICGLVLKHKYSLEVHLRRHYGDSKYPCRYCETSYFTANELKLHVTVAHLNTAKLQCNECGLAFKNNKSLSLHMKTHSEQRSFSCDECSMTFKTPAILRRHQNNVHRGIKFNCTMCTVSYGRKDKLRMHMEKIHKVQTYFPCEICLKSFTTALDLDEHIDHHRHPKELECPTCLSAFLDAKDFEEHLCITYRDDYYCCDRDFKYHVQYNKHMFLVHGMKTNARIRLARDQLLGAARASRKQTERCTKCEKVFATRKLKKDHMTHCFSGGNLTQMEVDQVKTKFEFHEGTIMGTEENAHQLT